MKTFSCAVFICLVLSEVGYHVKSNPVLNSNNDRNEAGTNFRKFAYNLLDLSVLEQTGEARGAAALSPFGVGYTLADINAKVYNVSNHGFERLFEIPEDKISADYASLLEKLKQGKFTTKNVLYVRNRNNSVNLPLEASKQLQIEVVHTDYVSDWKNSWHLMNGMIANQTGGKLDDQLIAKGGWYGGSFYSFTVGAYINTNHHKLAWHKSWTPVGEKKFSDGASLPYYQVEGKYSALENENYSVVIVPIKNLNSDISAIFLLPKENITQLTKEDLAPFFKTASANAVRWENTHKTVQIPAFNITMLSQHFRELKQLGMNDTFCLPDDNRDPVSGAEEAGGKEEYIARRPYFADPIAQATHLEISPDFAEVASATGVGISSMKKLFEFREGNNGEGSSGSDSSSGAGLTKPDNKKASGNGVKGGSRQKRTVKGGNAAATAAKVSSSKTTTTTERTDVDKENVLIFNKPFIWLLHDSDLGTLYYGSVNSIAQYKKELEPQEGFEWLQDTVKSVVWNCP